MQCGTNAAAMHWEAVEGVELYVATATCRSGMSLQCNSTNSTCEFSNLQCGATYLLSVTAYSNMCYSEVSSPVEVQTGQRTMSMSLSFHFNGVDLHKLLAKQD